MKRVPCMEPPESVYDVRTRAAGTRVLAVSGLADDESNRAHPSLTFGDAQLGKPFTADSLLRKVAELLEAPRV